MRYQRPLGILVVTFAIVVGLLLVLAVTTGGKVSNHAGTNRSGARHDLSVSPLHPIRTALTTTMGAENYTFDYSTTFQPGTESDQQVPSPPITTSGHGVVNLSPYVMLSANSADSSFPNVTAVVDDTDVWEFGAGDYGTGGSGGVAPGSPLPGFAQLVEGSLGQGQGALAMIALANPSGRLSLDQNMVSSVQQVGTGSVDGVPVTIYQVSIDLSRVLDQSGLSSNQQTAMSQALASLSSQGYEGTNEIVSIDAAGFIREVKSVASFSNGGSMTSDTILSEIGCAGTVTPGDPVPSPAPPGCVSPDQPELGLPSTTTPGPTSLTQPDPSNATLMTESRAVTESGATESTPVLAESMTFGQVASLDSGLADSLANQTRTIWVVTVQPSNPVTSPYQLPGNTVTATYDVYTVVIDAATSIETGYCLGCDPMGMASPTATHAPSH